MIFKNDKMGPKKSGGPFVELYSPILQKLSLNLSADTHKL